MKVGDEVWVRAVVTSIKEDCIGIGVRSAARKGSRWAGSSTKTDRYIEGVGVCRVVRVPTEDVRS